MAKSTNHYDVAFEELLRRLRRPYVSVNEQRRSLAENHSLKSMDFIVYSQQSRNLLVDVKGRKLLPKATAWKNWASEDDLISLMRWEQVFGDGFQAMIVFAYELTSLKCISKHSLSWEILGRSYAFYGVWAKDYAQNMKPFSRRWKTVNLPTPAFERMRIPLLDVL